MQKANFESDSTSAYIVLNVTCGGGGLGALLVNLDDGALHGFRHVQSLAALQNACQAGVVALENSIDAELKPHIYL